MQVTVNGGIYKIRGNDTDVSDVIFTLVEDFKVGANGGYVTVDGRDAPGFPDRNIKIRCDSAEAVLATDGTQVSITPQALMPRSTGTQIILPKEPVSTETDEEIIERLRIKFALLEDMTLAAKQSRIRAMIVFGPPGVGKTHGIEKVLSKYDSHSAVSGMPPKYELVSGGISSIGLYMKLFHMSSEKDILVFDDCDDVFEETTGLNLLKSALDSKKKRVICWNKDSPTLEAAGIPNFFEFKGSVIFITNTDFANVKSKKLRDHLNAIESRCHYMDLTIKSGREKMLRIKQIMEDGMLAEHNFSKQLEADIYEFVSKNQDNLRDHSLRTIVKIAELVHAFPEEWEMYAENTLMR